MALSEKNTSPSSGALSGLIGKIRKIAVTDEYAMEFFPGASESVIMNFERTNSINFPKLVKEWLHFTDGCSLFDTLILFYGVDCGRRIEVQDNGFICIGIFNYGDIVCVKSGSEKIYLCGETIIEYADFTEFLTLVIKIGTKG